MSSIKHPGISVSWTHLFTLWTIQGVISLWQLASLPSDAESGLLFGFSASRLAGIGFLVSWVVFFIVLAIKSRRDGIWKKSLDSIFSSRTGDVMLVASFSVAIISQIVMAILWGLSQRGEIFKYAAYATRLAPILNLLALSALELILWIVIHRRDIFEPVQSTGKDLLKRALIIWGLLGALTIFVIVTGLGIIPDRTGTWGLPGVALLEWQILLAGSVCVLVMMFEASGMANKIKRFDLCVAAALWLGTSLLWISQPVVPALSAMPPRAPNYEIYPYIDAQVYDEYAQSILIGNGMRGIEIPSRPLYIVFLAFLHALVGQDYNSMIAAQSLLLAFLPVTLYWIGKDFYGRPVGITIAMLAALRDATSNIAAPFTNNLSYSKLYLSELPTAVFLVLFIWLSIRWARSNYPNYLAFIAGGLLGIGIMIRTQAVAALPVLLVIAWLADRKKLLSILRGAVWMMLAIILVISPWIWRNYRNTGKFIFDSPATQTINLAQRYGAMSGMEPDVVRHPDETNTEYNDRLMQIFIEAVSRNPLGAVRVVTNRFLNNCVANILILPLRNDLVNLSELWQPDRPFWEHWDGTPTLSQSALLGFYIFLFGLGLAASWKRLGLLAFVPLGVNLLYNLWTSITLLSGQRFLLAMDWCIYMYYLIGLFVLISGFMYLLNSARPIVLKWFEQPKHNEMIVHENKTWKHYLIAGTLFFAVGVSIPVSEKIFPKRYPPLAQEQLWSEFSSSNAFVRSDLDTACMTEFIAQNNLRATNGRVLSPRYYGPGEGEPTLKFGYRVSDQPRMVFLMTGNYNGLAVLELAESPVFFPNASDVLVYIDKGETSKAWFVLVKDAEREEVYLSEEFKSSGQCNGAP